MSKKEKRITEVKLIIKKWKGKPIDVIYYLAKTKVIEKAVTYKFNKVNRK